MPSGAPPAINFSQLQYAKPTANLGQQMQQFGQDMGTAGQKLFPSQPAASNTAAGTGLPGNPYAGPVAPNAGAPGQPTPGQAVAQGMSPAGLLQWLRNNMSPPVTPQGMPITAAANSPQTGMLPANNPLSPAAGPGIPFTPVQPVPFGGG